MNVQSKMTERLRMVAELVPECGCAADIGTDHAYVPIMLLQSGRIVRAIVSDIRKGPLAIAVRNANKYGVQDLCVFHQSNGLQNVPNDMDTIVIAGMGGTLIADILQNSPFNLLGKTLILQPMTAVYELRKYLSENGFCILDECIAKEEYKLYICLKAEKIDHDGENVVQPNSDEFFYYIGEKLIEKRHPLLIDLISREIQVREKMIQGMEKSEREIDRREILFVTDRLKKLRQELLQT